MRRVGRTYDAASTSLPSQKMRTKTSTSTHTQNPRTVTHSEETHHRDRSHTHTTPRTTITIMTARMTTQHIRIQHILFRARRCSEARAGTGRRMRGERGKAGERQGKAGERQGEGGKKARGRREKEGGRRAGEGPRGGGTHLVLGCAHELFRAALRALRRADNVVVDRDFIGERRGATNESARGREG